MPDIVKIVITSSHTSDSLDKNITDHDQISLTKFDQVWPLPGSLSLVLQPSAAVKTSLHLLATLWSMSWCVGRYPVEALEEKCCWCYRCMLPRSIDVYRCIQYIYMIILDLPGISMMIYDYLYMMFYVYLDIFGIFFAGWVEPCSAPHMMAPRLMLLSAAASRMASTSKRHTSTDVPRPLQSPPVPARSPRPAADSSKDPAVPSSGLEERIYHEKLATTINWPQHASTCHHQRNFSCLRKTCKHVTEQKHNGKNWP